MSLFRKLFSRIRSGETPPPDPTEAVGPSIEEEFTPGPVPEPFLDSLPAPEAEAPPEPAAAEPQAVAPAWFSRLKEGLSKSSNALSTGITDIFAKRRLNQATLDSLEDILIGADLGLDMAARVTAALARGRYDREIAPDAVKRVLAGEVAEVLRPVEVPFVFDETRRPFVILVVGANGSGKTTTIGKLGAIARREGFSVMLAACDTFRAAAIEQLSIWGDRIGAKVLSRPPGADAAGLAFDALNAARDDGTDILIIDTAGRLHNKANLMAELEKIIRVLKKTDPSAPHATLLVLDATTGQNAVNQVETFLRIAGITGLVMTKLDGTARGGILVALAHRFALPVHAVGVGEGIDDLQPFDAAAFSRAIAGLGPEERS
jgi:fused signal recognition particle receptor